MSTRQILQLPEKIKVILIKGSGQTLIAELPEYDIFTEADSFAELIPNVNDLLYEYFEIPKAMQNTFVYMPPELEEKVPNLMKTPLSIFYQQYVIRGLHK